METPNPSALNPKVGYSLVLWLILLAAAIAFWNGLSGDFVYDDRKQILENPFVQRLDLLPQGLTSDVWAFKGPGSTWSNYWRPGFTAWSALNWQLGGASPMAWHGLNLLLHLFAVALAFNLLLRLRYSVQVAGFATLLFAIHPTRVESVTWIAGSPDLLAAAGILLSFHRLVSWRTGGKPSDLALSVGLFLLAVLCKEVVLATLLLVPIILARVDDTRETATPSTGKAKVLIPFAISAVAFLAMRYAVLGFFSRPFPDSPSWAQTILTAPKVLLFYLGQCVWPSKLGVVHDLRPATAADLSQPGYWFALAVAIGLAAFAWLLVRRNRECRLGIALFIVPLLPAFLLRSFRPDDLVHDRYLYLPMLGFGVLVAVLLDRALSASKWKGTVMAGLGALVAAASALVVVDYNRAWQDNVALWTRTTEVSPSSRMAWTELGASLQLAKRPGEAEAAIDRALAVGPPLDNTLIVYGLAAKDRGDLPLAKQRLEEAVSKFPSSYVGWEHLAVVHNEMGDTEGAIQTFREASLKMPSRADLYAVNIAVIYAQVGMKAEAVAELKPRRDSLARSPDPHVSKGLFFLGMLEADLGATTDAAKDLRAFLEKTAAAADPQIRQFQQQAIERLKSL